MKTEEEHAAMTEEEKALQRKKFYTLIKARRFTLIKDAVLGLEDIYGIAFKLSAVVGGVYSALFLITTDPFTLITGSVITAAAILFTLSWGIRLIIQKVNHHQTWEALSLIIEEEIPILKEQVGRPEDLVKCLLDDALKQIRDARENEDA